MKFTINRATWLRGEGGDQSFLFRQSDNKMCCLGFFGRACGIAPLDMRAIRVPRDILELWEEDQEWLVSSGESGSDAEALMIINDNPRLTDAEREATIIVIFAKHNVEVEFIDGTPT